MNRFPPTQPRSFMPGARADEFRRAASRLGFQRARQVGSHERWKHQDGRSATIPIKGAEISVRLFSRGS